MSTLQKIIILEQDVALARMLRDGLKKSFSSVRIAFDAMTAVSEIKSLSPDFLMADTAALNGKSVPAFCREIRALTSAPLLLFSEKAQPVDKARALDAGADDYMEKPLDLREAASRIQAIWRRCMAQPPAVQARQPRVVEYPGLVVSLSNYTVIYDGHIVEMPPKELELLYFLAKSPNRVFTREQLLDQIWGYDFVGGARTVDVHIKRIRQKIKDHETWSIDTVWGVGYKFSTIPSHISSDGRSSEAAQNRSV